MSQNSFFEYHLSNGMLIISCSRAANTDKSYQVRGKKWTEFCQRAERSSTQPSVELLVAYVSYLSTDGKKTKKGERPRGFKYSSVKQYLSYVSATFNYDFPYDRNPVAHPHVQRALAGARRMLGNVKLQALPFTIKQLELLYRYWLDRRSPFALVTFVLASIGLFAALRCANLVPANQDSVKGADAHNVARVLDFGTVAEKLAAAKQSAQQPIRHHHLEVHEEGLLIRTPQAKMNQFGDKAHSVLLPRIDRGPLKHLCPTRAYETLKLHPDLRNLKPEAFVSSYGSKTTQFMTRNRFLQEIRVRAPAESTISFIAGENRTMTTGHSFRRGFMYLSMLLHVPLHEAMRHAGWVDVQTAYDYANGVVFESPMQQRLNDDASSNLLSTALNRANIPVSGEPR